MERARLYLKVAAVISAVCLVGGFVAYRAGAFDSPPPPAPPPTEPARSPEPQPPPAPTPERPTSPIFMAGSKSAWVYDESALKALTQSSIVNSPGPQPAGGSTFMGGSKSDRVFDPAILGLPPAGQPNTQPPAPPKKDQ